jgi:hypothetical protein
MAVALNCCTSPRCSWLACYLSTCAAAYPKHSPIIGHASGFRFDMLAATASSMVQS